MPNKKKRTTAPKRKPTPKVPKQELQVASIVEREKGFRALWQELMSDKQNRVLLVGVAVAVLLLVVVGAVLVFAPKKQIPAATGTDGGIQVDTNADGRPDATITEDQNSGGGIFQ